MKINKGEFVALMGSNGSGKSTLAKHINASLIPSKGEIFIDSLNTKNESNNFDIKKRVGMIFQDPDMQIIHSTIPEEIAFGMENLNIPRSVMEETISLILKQTNLEKLKKVPTYFLSGGQKQRLALASVLAMNPEIIVLDEPTSMLDPQSKKDILSLIKQLNLKKHLTVVLITHHVEEAFLADKIFMMNKGEITKSGTPQEILLNFEFMKKAGISPLPSTIMMKIFKNNGYNVSTKKWETKECAEEIIKSLEKNR